MTSSLLFHIKHSPPADSDFQFTNGDGGKNPILSETEISVSFGSLIFSILPLEQIIWKEQITWKYSNTCCIDTGEWEDTSERAFARQKSQKRDD